MKYLVMECHKAYALVLSSEGKFLKVANRNYKVGQRIDSVIELSLPQNHIGGLISIRALRFASAAAASLLLIATGWSGLLRPFGYIHMHINPDIGIKTNRLGYVLEVEAEDEDAKLLLKDYRFRFAKSDQVIREIADLCVEQEFLQKGGEILIYAKSSDEKWEEKEESRTKAMLEEYYGGEIRIRIEDEKAQEIRREEKKESQENTSVPLPATERSIERKDADQDFDLEEEREEREEESDLEERDEDEREEELEQDERESKEREESEEIEEREEKEEKEEQKDTPEEEEKEEDSKEEESKKREREDEEEQKADDEDARERREEADNPGEDADDED